MEPTGSKGGWRSFTTSVFRGGGGGVGGGVGVGGEGECLSVRQIHRSDHVDSSIAMEDEGIGEDVSLLENRPVDQKKLRKRSQGHTQRLLLEDSDIPSSKVPLSVERCQTNKLRPRHHHSNPQSIGISLSITPSSSFSKFQSNLDASADGELLWQEDRRTSAIGLSAADETAVDKSTVFEQHSTVQKNLGCLSNRARNSFIDGILLTKQFAKEPALGNLIDFDSDGLSN